MEKVIQDLEKKIASRKISAEYCKKHSAMLDYYKHIEIIEELETILKDISYALLTQ